MTIADWYDGPRLGIAEYRGVPHIYEAEFDHNSDDYGDTYYVSPVSPDLLDLIMEDWQIWIRWDQAFASSAATLDTHPALPADRERHDALKHAIGSRYRSDPANRRRLRAVFHGSDPNVEWADV
jgi:hypothetical protein